MGTEATVETSRAWWSEVGGVMVALRRRTCEILSSTQPADRRASASWSQHSSAVSQIWARPCRGRVNKLKASVFSNYSSVREEHSSFVFEFFKDNVKTRTCADCFVTKLKHNWSFPFQWREMTWLMLQNVCVCVCVCVCVLTLCLNQRSLKAGLIFLWTTVSCRSSRDGCWPTSSSNGSMYSSTGPGGKHTWAPGRSTSQRLLHNMWWVRCKELVLLVALRLRERRRNGGVTAEDHGKSYHFRYVYCYLKFSSSCHRMCFALLSFLRVIVILLNVCSLSCTGCEFFLCICVFFMSLWALWIELNHLVMNIYCDREILCVCVCVCVWVCVCYRQQPCSGTPAPTAPAPWRTCRFEGRRLAGSWWLPLKPPEPCNAWSLPAHTHTHTHTHTLLNHVQCSAEAPQAASVRAAHLSVCLSRWFPRLKEYGETKVTDDGCEVWTQHDVLTLKIPETHTHTHTHTHRKH